MIVDAMTLAQKQTTRHLLQELEGLGVVTLASARKIIAESEMREHQQRQRVRRVRPVKPACPECGVAAVDSYSRRDLDGAIVVIKKCGACAFSWIMEGGNG